MAKYRLFLVILLAIVLVAQPVSFRPVFVAAQTAEEEIEELNQQIADRKEKIQELEKSISKINDDIKAKQTQAVSLRNQISILDQQIEILEKDIELTTEKIEATQLEIDLLEKKIAEKEAAIAKQKKIIAKMLRDINKEDRKNYLEIMLTQNSFAEFYNQLQYLQDVNKDLGRSAKNLRLVKEKLNEDKASEEKKQNEQKALKTELEAKKLGLDNQVNAKENLLVQTRSSEQRFRTLRSSLRQQYQQIESEVRSFEAQVRKKLAALDKLGTSSTGAPILTWPTPSRYVTAYFHDPTYPYRHIFEHNAIDIAAWQGTPLRAAAAGYVGRARHCSTASCYSYVLLIHTGGISTVYGHMSRITVGADQFVNRGDIIGYSGGTPGTSGAGPFVTGPHLHFEVRLNGIPVNPLNYLSG